MRRALELARLGEGSVEPNPMVGSVICQGERIIGQGYHRQFGGPHAEIEALKGCTESPNGATVYVTLEPCAHFGKTPPCVDALLAAGVRRVVAAVRDPNPAVVGAGFARLREAGVQVDEGAAAAAAMELLAPFATLVREKRPYIIAKWAQTADGRLVTRPDEDRWISCGESRAWVHRLRARVDGVLVGANTVLRDDPLLTARDVPLRRRCMRIVLDRQLRIPLSCKLVRTAREQPTLVFTGPRAAGEGLALRLRDAGVEVVAAPIRGDGEDIRAVLGLLGSRGATNVLVEGGPTVLAGFFREKLIDEAYTFVAPPSGESSRMGLPGAPDASHIPAGFEHGLKAISHDRFMSGIDTCHHRRFTTPARLWNR